MRVTSGSELITLRKHQLPQRPQHVSVTKRKSKVRDVWSLSQPSLCDGSHTHTVFHSTDCDGFFTIAADEPRRLEIPLNSSKSQDQDRSSTIHFLTISWQWLGLRIGPHWHRFRHDFTCFRLIEDMRLFPQKHYIFRWYEKIKDPRNVKSAQAELQHRQAQTRRCGTLLDSPGNSFSTLIIDWGIGNV